MTLQEALAIARTAQLKQPPSLDKLQGSVAGAATARIVELNKRFDVISQATLDLQKRLDQIAADVEYIGNFKPGSMPRRLQ